MKNASGWRKASICVFCLCAAGLTWLYLFRHFEDRSAENLHRLTPAFQKKDKPGFTPITRETASSSNPVPLQTAPVSEGRHEVVKAEFLQLRSALNQYGLAPDASSENMGGLRRQIVSLVQSLGKEALYQILQGEKDDRTLRAALYVLYCFESAGTAGPQFLSAYLEKEILDKRFIQIIENLVFDGTGDPRLRGMAIRGIGFLPKEEAERVFRSLLSQPGVAPRPLLSVLSVSLACKEFSPELNQLATRRGLETYANLAADEGDRLSGLGLLEKYPEHIVHLMRHSDAEPSEKVRLALAQNCASIMADNPNHEAAAWVIPRIAAYARQPVHPMIRVFLILKLGARGLRETHGPMILGTLLDVARGSDDASVRVAAINSIANAGYIEAVDTLRSLVNDPSAQVNESAKSAIDRLTR